MRIEQLSEIFVKHLGARKDGGALLVPAEAEASMYVGLEGTSLTISKVTRIEYSDTLVFVDTGKGERYVVGAEDVLAVKIDKGGKGTAGFGK